MFEPIGKMTSLITRGAGRSLLIARKFSPEVLTGVGIAGFATTIVLACRATVNARQTVAEFDTGRKTVKTMRFERDPKVYSDSEYRKDLAYVYFKFSKDLLKIYGPSITTGLASTACILGAQKIMSGRNAALIAAYKAVEQSFSTYRGRVREEFGEERDRDLSRGVVYEQVDLENSEGKKSRQIVASVDPNKISEYARFFDETCNEWDRNAEYNLMFLKARQTYANDMLRARGHVFLNEVYDMLGIPRTKAGAVVGWVISKDGDNFVDFGIYNPDNPRAADFVNGYEKSILLDFNVDGVIYDKI